MLLIITIVLIILYLFLFFDKKENFENEEISVSNYKDEDDGYSINLNFGTIDELIKMSNYISDSSNNIPDSFANVPSELKNNNTYLRILYDSYIIDFLDKYVVDRFNCHIFLDIVYYYPDYEEYLNDSERDKKSLLKNYNEFLNLTISNMKNLNFITEDFFLFTMSEVRVSEMNILKKEIKKMKIENFESFYNSHFKSYINKIFKKLNYKLIGNSDELFFEYEFKEINNDNKLDIFDTVVEIIENESTNYNSFINN